MSVIYESLISEEYISENENLFFARSPYESINSYTDVYKAIREFDKERHIVKITYQLVLKDLLIFFKTKEIDFLKKELMLQDIIIKQKDILINKYKFNSQCYESFIN